MIEWGNTNVIFLGVKRDLEGRDKLWGSQRKDQW